MMRAALRGVVYGEPSDKKRDESWLRCAACSQWFHDSCAQINGILDHDDSYTGVDCVN
jgi:hypothetical protein